MLKTLGQWGLAAGATGVTGVGGCVAPASDAPSAAETVSLATLAEDHVVPLRRAGAYCFAPVAVGGKPAGQWLLDTGSSATIVELGVARRLGLEPVAEGRVRGIGGTQTIGWLGPHTVAIGDAAVRVQRLGRLNLYALNRVVPYPLSGIVGFDVLATGPVTLHPVATPIGPPRLVFHRRGDFDPPLMKAVALQRQGALPAVDAELAGGGRTRLVLDTGQDIELTLPRSIARRYPGIFAASASGPTGSVGVGGSASGSRAWVAELTAMGHRFRDVPVKIEDRGEFGRLGMGLLRTLVLAFDAPAGRLWTRPVAR